MAVTLPYTIIIKMICTKTINFAFFEHLRSTSENCSSLSNKMYIKNVPFYNFLSFFCVFFYEFMVFKKVGTKGRQ